jgi:hypothetical protein
MEVAVLNDNSDQVCYIKDERQNEFVFPRSVIEASTTAGRHEVMRFRSRIETAQRVMNRAGDFKSFFAGKFQPAVFQLAYLIIGAEALKTLLGMLVARGVPPEGVSRDCQKYPYLKLSRKSSGHFAIKLVKDAISYEGIAFELERKLHSLLEQLLPQEHAGSWGSSHILAWAMNDCANQQDLRDRLLALPPDQADAAIWDRAWHSDEFLGYFAMAVFI